MNIANPRKIQVPDVGVRGFSLLEMSVSIIIIAFLLAAVLKGQTILEDAKLQAIVSEISNHQVAVNSFYAKYAQYPGDFAIATGTTGEWGAGTSYGDNNGKIEFKNSSGIYEGYRLWQHLNFAGMISAQYTGTQTTSAAISGTDVPLSKTGGGYLFDYSNSSSAYDGIAAGAYGILSKNVMLLGVPLDINASPVKIGGILTASQAMAIDTKIDDGLPNAGNVMGAAGISAASTCVSGSIYSITVTGVNCIMIFSTGNQ